MKKIFSISIMPLFLFAGCSSLVDQCMTKHPNDDKALGACIRQMIGNKTIGNKTIDNNTIVQDSPIVENTTIIQDRQENITSNLNSMCDDLKKNFDKFTSSHSDSRILNKAKREYDECLKKQADLKTYQ